MAPPRISQAGIKCSCLQVILSPDARDGWQIECFITVRIQRKILVKREQGVETHHRVDKFQQGVGKLREDVGCMHVAIKP